MNNSILCLFLIVTLFSQPTFSVKSRQNLKNIQKSIEKYEKLTSFVAQSLGSKLLVGYWHNFDNGIGILPLSQVSSKWDVIDLSFGETGADQATVLFTPCYGTVASFITEIKGLQALGKKVLLSLGGQNGIVTLTSNALKTTFINSVYALVTQYGFDGIDIDLENGIILDGGDSDFKNPKTVQLVNLISALRTIKSNYGANFIISMAPEVAYVQGGMSAYGGVWGAYLPVIYGIRDILTYVHVQHYNAGGATGKDGNYYTQGTADFEVAMADALLSGFVVNYNKSNVFPALNQNQVMIGLPSNAQAAPSGGYIAPTEMIKALNYIIKGVSFGGKYVLTQVSGYQNFRGLMTWSINWDKYNNFEFSTSYKGYFGGSTSTAATTGTTSTASTTTTPSTSGTTTTTSSNNGTTSTTTQIPSTGTTTSDGSTYTVTTKLGSSCGSSTTSTSTTTATTPSTTTNISAFPAWTPGVAYKVGDKVTYNGNNYQCINPHTSIVSWEPTNAFTLWKQI